jgi:hypothetical protein
MLVAPGPIDDVTAIARLRCFGIGDGRVRHGLLVLAAPGRQGIADAAQCLADPGDIAVPEDRPDAVDEALALLGHLHGQPSHHGLRGGRTNRPCHGARLLQHVHDADDGHDSVTLLVAERTINGFEPAHATNGELQEARAFATRPAGDNRLIVVMES